MQLMWDTNELFMVTDDELCKHGWPSLWVITFVNLIKVYWCHNSEYNFSHWWTFNLFNDLDEFGWSENFYFNLMAWDDNR